VTNGDPRAELAGRNVRPIVARPRAGLSGPMMIVGAAGLALLLFLLLDAHRRSLATSNEHPVASAVAPIRSPAPLQLPPSPLPPLAGTSVPGVVQPVPAPAPVQHQEAPLIVTVAPPGQSSVSPGAPLSLSVSAAPGERHGEANDGPVLIVDATPGNASAGSTSGSQSNPRDQSAAAGADGEEAVRATLIRNRQSVVPQGTLIAAALETPLNSDRPGLARAVVSRETRSFDGSRVLIPRGSRLIGEFKADANADQRRVLVTWTRLIRPDGVAIRIGSPAADALGGAGIPGKVNTHFLERFTNAVLQSALTIGINRASQVGAGSSSVYLGLPGQLGAVGQSLLPNANPHTTVKVKAGAEIAIFVARDLDFGGTPAVR